MDTETHPSEIGQYARYRRVVGIARSTSRLKNNDWYREALDLDVQLHLYYVEDARVLCFLYQRTTNQYEKLEDFTQHQLDKYDEIKIVIDEILNRDDLKKSKSLGVIVHLADELSLAGLGPEHQNPTALDELRTRMSDSVTEILEDKTITGERKSWRLFPYTGAEAGSEFATAVAVTREPSSFLEKMRAIGEENNFPIKTAALCAPLGSISALPWFIKANEQGTIAVFNYQKFTLLAICDEKCDLLMLRYLPHPNGKGSPANIGAAALASASSFELEGPEVNIFSMAGNDIDGIIVSLQSSLNGSEIMVVETGAFLESKNMPSHIPLEVLASTQRMEADQYQLASNNTFTVLQEENWCTQDFLKPSNEELEMHPSEEDMKILKLGRLMKKIAAVLLIGAVVYATLNIISKIRTEAWTYKKTNTKATAAKLHAELADYQKWNNLLKDRSKAWVSMELITQMVPDDGSVILKDAKHRVIQKQDSGAKNIGFQKEWSIVGQANEKGIAVLGNVSTREGIKKLFREVASATGNEAYIPDTGHRDVTVNLKQDANPRRVDDGGGEQYMPYTFRMTIRQSFGSKDAMAIAGAKYTKKK